MGWWPRGGLVVVVVAAAVFAGCGGDGGADSSPPGPTASTAPTTSAASAPADDADVAKIDVSVVEGAVVDDGRREVSAGERVRIRVTADVSDEVHVHGYDKKADVAPGAPATIVFVADIPGIFEVELESRGLKLFDLVVR